MRWYVLRLLPLESSSRLDEVRLLDADEIGFVDCGGRERCI